MEAHQLASLLANLRLLETGVKARPAQARDTRDELLREIDTTRRLPLQPAEAAVLANMDYLLRQSGLPEGAARSLEHATNAAARGLAQLLRRSGNRQALERVLHLHHRWSGRVRLPSAAELLRGLRPVLEPSLAEAHRDSALPDASQLLQLVREDSPNWDELADYFLQHGDQLREIECQAGTTLSRLAEHVEGSLAARQFRHVLVIEDDDSWRRLITAVARAVVAPLGGLHVHGVSCCDDARSFADVHGRDGVVAICDVELPDSADDLPSQESGLRLIRLLAETCHVIIMTSIEYLDCETEWPGVGLEDFIPKTLPEWQGALEERLRAALLPCSFVGMRIIVPVFAANCLLVGGVWVPVGGRQFAIVDAAARGWPTSPGEYFGLLPRYRGARPAKPPPARQPEPISLRELKTIMCLRELGNLPADFMETFDLGNLRESVGDLAAGVASTFGEAGIRIQAGGFLRVENRNASGGMVSAQAGEATSPSVTSGMKDGPPVHGAPGTYEDRVFVHVRAQVQVCDTPEQFHSATQACIRPLRVLVVEDDGWWRDQIRRTLEGLSPAPEIQEAQTYEEALMEGRLAPPDFVVLDLNIPRDATAVPETGVRLRRELTKLNPEAVVVVVTGYDVPTLVAELLRPAQIDAVDSVASGFRALREWRRRVQADAILLKRHGSGALWGLLHHARRVQRDFRARGLVLAPLSQPHEIWISEGEAWGLGVDGVRIQNGGQHRSKARDHALVQALGYWAGANLPLRRQAIIDEWRDRGLLDDVRTANLTKLLSKRVEAVRRLITEQTGLSGGDVIETCQEGYRLVGNVALGGHPPQ